jgi:hypothetical protein
MSISVEVEDYILEVSDENTINILGKTYVIKDMLKDEGARWNPDEKVWYFSNMTLQEAEDILQKVVSQREQRKESSQLIFELEESPQKVKQSPRKRPLENVVVEQSPRKSPRQAGIVAPVVKVHNYKEVEKYIIRAKSKWNKYIKNLGMTTQKVQLKNASVKMYYVGHKNSEPRFHNVIRYIDTSLEKYAIRITDYLQSKGLKVIHNKGSFVDEFQI